MVAADVVEARGPLRPDEGPAELARRRHRGRRLLHGRAGRRSTRSALAAGLGTALVACGAAAINQVSERDIDRRMDRTRSRPVAEGRMSPAEGLATGAVLAVLGAAILWAGANALAAAIGVRDARDLRLGATRRSSGARRWRRSWAPCPARCRRSSAGRPRAARLAASAPWTLFLLMFLWQLPHFLAISWMCRDDYRVAGLPMLSVIDRDGSMTGRQAALWTATLVPFSVLPFLVLAHPAYIAGALLLGVGLLVAAVRFAVERVRCERAHAVLRVDSVPSAALDAARRSRAFEPPPHSTPRSTPRRPCCSRPAGS